MQNGQSRVGPGENPKLALQAQGGAGVRSNYQTQAVKSTGGADDGQGRGGTVQLAPMLTVPGSGGDGWVQWLLERHISPSQKKRPLSPTPGTPRALRRRGHNMAKCCRISKTKRL